MKAVLGKTVYTGDSAAVKDCYVCFEGQTIVSVSQNKPACDIVSEFDTITPAFIDSHSHIGLDRAGEPYSESDVNEHMSSLLFGIDSLDALQMDDQSFEESIEHGVLYSSIMPGSGNIIAGKSVLIRNYAKNSSEAFMKYTGIKAAFGYNPTNTTEWKGERPNTRMGALGMLRNVLKKSVKTKALLEKGKKISEEIDPEEDIVLSLLNGETMLRAHVHKEDDIFTLLRLQDEFKLKVSIEHAGDVHSKDIFVQLREKGIPLVYGPADSFPYKSELRNESWKNVRHVVESGVKYALMSDHPVTLQRNLPLQLRFLRRFGVSKAECISKITGESADILGAEKLGRLAQGKFASIVCWNGDPFSLDSYPVQVYAEGTKVHEVK